MKEQSNNRVAATINGVNPITFALSGTSIDIDEGSFLFFFLSSYPAFRTFETGFKSNNGNIRYT